MIANLVPPLPEWFNDALCARVDPHPFHPERHDIGAIHTARTICGACPVAEDCFEYAMRTGQPDGIWGGTTPRQRGQLRRRLRERRTA